MRARWSTSLRRGGRASRLALGTGTALVLALAVPGAANAASNWTLQPVPLPAGSNDGGLTSVSCVSATSCMAVGTLVQGPDAFVEHWDGSTWTPEAISVSGMNEVFLEGVSCTAADSCMAVGFATPSATGKTQTLAEYWNGSTWTTLSTPSPGKGSHDRSELLGVSCVASGKCMAVGDTQREFISHTTPLAEFWNGSKWVVKRVPPVAGNFRGEFEGVSCAAANACMAVGRLSTSRSQTLAEFWNGKDWQIENTPDPSASYDSLKVISCTSRTHCMAVGEYDSSELSAGLAEIWAGGTWTAHPVPLLGMGISNVLNGVSCASTASCTAVGTTTGSHARAMAERWNGKAWTSEQTASVASRKDLVGVSCLAGGFCEAVGNTFRQGVQTPVAEGKAG